MRKKIFSEILGTYSLVLFGCGAVVVDTLYGGIVGHLGINIIFGAIIMIMIYSIGDISGAHMNPAVTFAFYLDKQVELKTLITYAISQTIGALLAAYTLKLLFPSAVLLGNTIPSGSHVQTFVAEVLFSFLLFMLIINVSEGPKETGIMAGIAIGSYIMIAGMINGPIGGNSLNPARTIGPAVASMNFHGFYIYLIAPLLGTGIASKASRLFR